MSLTNRITTVIKNEKESYRSEISKYETVNKKKHSSKTLQ